MSLTLKRRLALTVTAGALVAQFVAILLQWNYWPLSTFPMFSYRKTTSEAAEYEVRGVRNDGSEFKIFTPESRALSGLYVVLIEKGEWGKLRDQVLTLKFDKSETREIQILRTQVTTNNGVFVGFQSVAVLTISTASGEFEVLH